MNTRNYITEEDLKSLGAEHGERDIKETLDELNDKVAALVGEEIIASLTPEDAEKLADMLDDAHDDEVARWVVNKVPDYPEIIDNSTDIVLGEFAESLDASQ